MTLRYGTGSRDFPDDKLFHLNDLKQKLCLKTPFHFKDELEDLNTA